MTAPFQPVANLWAKAILLVAAAAVAFGLLTLWFWPRSDYARHVSWIVEQPVPFSHQHHVAGLGIDCRFLPTSVEVSSTAGLPPTYTCMTCHSQIWTNAALLAPVREASPADKPIVWNRVNDLPDYVYFNHSIHIAKGVGCASCHGEVDHMALTVQGQDADHAVLPRLPSRSERQFASQGSNLQHGLAANERIRLHPRLYSPNIMSVIAT